MKKLFPIIVTFYFLFAQSQRAIITLYRDGYGLVKQPVTFQLSKGRNAITYSSIPDKIEPDSPFLSLNEGSVIYQRFNRDIFDTFTYLKSHLGEEITVMPVDGKTLKGELLDVSGGWISIATRKSVKMFNTSEVMQMSIGIGEIPSKVKPELSWEVNAKRDGWVAGELIYISQGFDWEASYRLIISPEEKRAKLISQAILKNETNLDFSGASIKLVEGHLHRAPQAIPGRRPMIRAGVGTLEKSYEAPGPPTREELGDYHIYSLLEKLSFPRNESITVTLQTEKEVEISRLYLFENRERSSKEEPLIVQLSFQNSQENQLGVPIPGGSFQIYRRLPDRSIEFAGEDILKQVPVGEVAKVIAGRAFDVIGKRTVVNYDRKKNSEEAVISLEIKNKRGDKINVQLTEHIYGDWVIKNPSHNYKKTDAQTIQFDLILPPNSSEIVNYTYRKEWK